MPRDPPPQSIQAAAGVGEHQSPVGNRAACEPPPLSILLRQRRTDARKHLRPVRLGGLAGVNPPPSHEVHVRLS